MPLACTGSLSLILATTCRQASRPVVPAALYWIPCTGNAHTLVRAAAGHIAARLQLTAPG